MSIRIEENKLLAPLTTLGVGGTARFFVRAETEADVVEAVEHARKNGLGLFVLGGGSNVLVSDDGFDGLVLQIAIRGITGGNASVNERAHDTEGTVIAAAGEDWDEFVRYCVSEDLAGVECLSGIPGSVGGTPVQNVGAYGHEVSETIVSVRCLDRGSGEIVTLSNADCGFSYRTSIFNTTERDRYIVLSATFRLTRGGAAKIAYPELEREMAGREGSLKAVREAVLRLRRRKSMVIEEDDPNSRSAGSFFKNPVVSYDKLDEIRESFENVPFFVFGDRVKIPAAWLIEKSGFAKGFEHGNAGISANHTLAIVNRGNATAAEIVELKEMIQARVAETFAIDLHPEPVFIGF
ncbi:MAG TPA: UDP-N-acetylmuramate dehydrogenase [Pyrinomonadaceae bacterium]|nr:UDP-N-acetylmuramate dehydrogenase [Pyrinomonadaceae bacterium]